MTTYQHSTDIVGYTFSADTYCPDCIVDMLPTGDGQRFDGWALAEGVVMSTEDNLDAIALAFGIDRYDEHTFDSDEFPKVIFRDAVEDDVCGNCSRRLDGAEEVAFDDADLYDDEDEDDDGSIAVMLDGLYGRPGVMDTVIRFAGTRQDNDARVVVAVDHRYAHDIVAAICDEDEALVYAQGWSISTLADESQVLVPTER